MSEKLKTNPSNTSELPDELEVAGSTADKFRVNPDDYPIFKHQSELDEHWGNNTPHYWNIDKTLRHFVTDTADLISVIDGTAERSRGDILPPIDHVIYLDKSARPVSWLVHTFWQDFSQEKEPAHSYLNIDRQPWLRRSGVILDLNGYSKNPDGSPHRNTFADFNTERIDPEDFARIRGLYIPGGIKNEDATEIMQTPSSLDGKNILIVDEVKRSGATLEIAKWLVKHAFPEAASVEGAYFWHGNSKSSPDGHESQMLSVPVWYNSQTTAGRGAGEIDPTFFAERHERFQTDRTRAQKFGSLVLSAFPDLDREVGQPSRELMREIQQMHRDYQAGKILTGMPRNYNIDRAADFIERQGVRLAPDSDPSPDTYVNVRKAIDARPPAF